MKGSYFFPMNHRSSSALAAIFSGPGRPFEIREFPIPSPGPGEVLVGITCCTICGSDTHTWHGRRQEPTPCVLGHEIVGRILAFGPESPRLDLRGEPLVEGDRITWTLAASCGTCFFCRRGLPQKCESLFKYGHSALSPGREFSGGFAGCCLLRAGTGIVRVPDAIEDALAAPANCAVATVAGTLRTAGAVEGATVAVIGAGFLGLTACAMARHLGAAEVIACDLDATREADTAAFGATRFAGPGELATIARDLTGGRGADLALEFSGSSQGVAAAIGVLRTGGHAVIAGTVAPVDPVALDPHDLVRRMLRIEGLHNYIPQDLVTAIDFLAAVHDRLPFGRLLGEHFPLAEIDTAFASSKPGRRTVIEL